MEFLNLASQQSDVNKYSLKITHKQVPNFSELVTRVVFFTCLAVIIFGTSW